MLTLAKVQDWHHRSLLVLWRVAFEDLVDELVVLLVELEGDAGVVVVGVTVLDTPPLALAIFEHYVQKPRPVRAYEGMWNSEARLTTWRVSLPSRDVALSDRHGGREALKAGLKAERKRRGVILEAIVGG